MHNNRHQPTGHRALNFKQGLIPVGWMNLLSLFYISRSLETDIFQIDVFNFAGQDFHGLLKTRV